MSMLHTCRLPVPLIGNDRPKTGSTCYPLGCYLLLHFCCLHSTQFGGSRAGVLSYARDVSLRNEVRGAYLHIYICIWMQLAARAGVLCLLQQSAV